MAQAATKTLVIHILNFSLLNELVDSNDEIRVSVTTLPEEIKQAFVISGQDMDYVHHFFKLNVTPNTKKILFVFRRMGFFNSDSIVASTILYGTDFPKTVSKPSQMYASDIETINIYEPVHSHSSHSKRAIVGQMQFQLLLTEPQPDDSEGKDDDQRTELKAKAKSNETNENVESNIRNNVQEDIQ